MCTRGRTLRHERLTQIAEALTKHGEDTRARAMGAIYPTRAGCDRLSMLRILGIRLMTSGRFAVSILSRAGRTETRST